jgi:hypothetical protein
MSFGAITVADQIPYYLSQEEKFGLVEALKNWPKPIQYYIKRYANEVLQGDAWTKLPIRNFSTGELAYIDGIILSNSCQIDPANDRHLPAKVTFAPLIDLGRYISLLERADMNAEQIAAKVTAIKEQRVHNVFYLPAGETIQNDQIALLDDVFSFPLTELDPRESSKNKKLETLSMVGFYLFVLKLSVHFCRLHENIERRDSFA